MNTFTRIKKEDISGLERFTKVNKGKLEKLLTGELDFVKRQVDHWLQEYASDVFPRPAGDEQNRYKTEKNKEGWTQGFFTGVIWLLFEWTGDQKYKEAALAHVKSFEKRINKRKGVDHHDLGFLYSLSCVACYKLTGNEKAKEVALKAADLLAYERYQESTKAIDRGRVFGVKDEHSVFIIDCSMNVPLLYWASEVTGNPVYRQRAYDHMVETVKHAIRDNCSCFQGIVKNIYTGEVVSKNGSQGYSDESFWSRGHAWAIYGTILTYRYTKDKRFLELCKKLSNFYINRLPKDLICNWDLIFVDEQTTRDTSAAGTAICGLLELAAQLPLLDSDKEIYEGIALNMLESLVKNYSAQKSPTSNGLLLSGVYVHEIDDPPRIQRKSFGQDTVCIWGDYFYMEAIMRALTPLNIYW